MKKETGNMSILYACLDIREYFEISVFEISRADCISDLSETHRAQDKREYWMIISNNFCYFWIKTCVATPHLNHLAKMVQMRGNYVWLQ